MAYNFKEDWERTKQIMNRIGTDLQYNASCQQWNREMADLVNAYKQEETAWYNSPQTISNGFQTTTQNLWYTHYLNKRRLGALGLRVRYDYIQPTGHARGENQRFPQWNYSHDGKNLICCVSDAMRYRKSFFAADRLVWTDEGKGLPGKYYIIQSRNPNGRYCCPSCGWEDALENFVDGCDYCQTKFQIDDLKQKVSSVYSPGNRTQERDGFTLKKNFIPMYTILVMAVMGIMVYASHAGTGMMLAVPAAGFLMIIIFLAFLMGKTSKESRKEGPAKTSQVLEQIRNTDPHFSEEAFIGNLSNKLMSICYADSAAQVRPFATIDVTPFMQTYPNVIDCRILECVLTEYHVDAGCQHLTAKVRLGLTACTASGIGQARPILKLGLVKSLAALTRSSSDVTVYRCASCGASLSLLNGGKCDYCGNHLDLREYDWVIEYLNCD